MSSDFYWYVNYHSTIDNEGKVGKNIIKKRSKIIFFLNSDLFSCITRQVFSLNVSVVTLKQKTREE